MAIPLTYNLRNLRVRAYSTVMTALSIGLVVAVFIGVTALARGLEEAFVTTGTPLNLVVLRQGSQVETSSVVRRDSLQVIKYLPGVAVDSMGLPLVSPELIVLLNLPKRDGGQGNVIVRGVSTKGFELRPQVRLVRGRPVRPGLREILVGRAVAERFQDAEPGAALRFGRSLWRVVGVFDAGRTAFDSEIWSDESELAQDFDRADYSSVLLRAESGPGLQAIQQRISEDRRLHLKALTEQAYYAEQTKAAGPIKVLGSFMAVVMAIGASFAVMNTMYAAVARRSREIGILRVLGFRPGSILLSFLAESLLLALVGGVVGCLLALPIHGLSTGTTNFRTFSEVSFAFRITPDLLLGGLAFSLVMGGLGGFLPARLASRQPMIETLREG
ncbi:MAG: ABC transporter permease [candidate division NC10 bacterium]|nr:ABC transporter permease [candidate division NC10 bacterium]MBI2116009.1 ABC transporter permease [candidate division NC10 bacterium]MBI3086302.1 ABC transporter permease [candidate division NC10 bacterium]